LLRSRDKAAAAAQLLELGHRLERRAEELLRLTASMIDRERLRYYR
jgi:hypothetical protein